MSHGARRAITLAPGAVRVQFGRNAALLRRPTRTLGACPLSNRRRSSRRSSPLPFSRPFLLAALLAAAAPASGLVRAASAQRATLERITHRDTLANGLEVLVIENHAVPIATVEMAFRTGAMSQTSDDQGVPHLFEHMLFRSYRGDGQRPFASEAGSLHAGYNGVTTEEMVAYYLTLPSANTASGVRLLSRLVRDPRFTQKDLNTERFVVLGEMDRQRSEPLFHLRQEVSKLLWGAAWPSKNPIGETLPLMAVTPGRLTGIYHRYYVPNNGALIVTGDVSAPAVLAMARRDFGGWQRSADPYAGHPVAAVPPLDSSRAVVVTGDVSDVTVLIEWQGPSVGTDPRGTYAADVFSDLVDDEESAFQKRLVDSGLFRTATVGYQTLDHVGPVMFEGTTTMRQLAAALTVLQTELRAMSNDDFFDPDALAVAQKRRMVQSAFGLEDGVSLAQSLGYTWSVAGLDYFLGYVDNMSAIGVPDLRAYVQRYLTKPYVIGVLARPADGSTIAGMLQQYFELSEAR